MKLRTPQSRELRPHTREAVFTPETENISFDWQHDFGEEQRRFINERMSELLSQLQGFNLSHVQEGGIISILHLQELFWNGQVLEQALGREIIDVTNKEEVMNFFQRWVLALKEMPEEESEIKFTHFSHLIRLHKTLAWLVTAVPGARQELGVNEELWEKWFPVFKDVWNKRTVVDHLGDKLFGGDVSEVEDLVAFALLFPNKLDTLRQELRSPNLNQTKGIPQDFTRSGMPELYVHGLGELLLVFPELRSQIQFQQNHWEEVNKWQASSLKHGGADQNRTYQMRHNQAFFGAAVLTAEEVVLDSNSQLRLIPKKRTLQTPPKLPERIHL